MAASAAILLAVAACHDGRASADPVGAMIARQSAAAAQDNLLPPYRFGRGLSW